MPAAARSAVGVTMHDHDVVVCCGTARHCRSQKALVPSHQPPSNIQTIAQNHVPPTTGIVDSSGTGCAWQRAVILLDISTIVVVVVVRVASAS